MSLLQGQEKSHLLVEAARSLADGIAERAAKVEAERCVAPESIEEMQAAGLFRALLPARFGGYECDLGDFHAMIVEIGKACPSTAWVLGVVGVHPFDFAHWNTELQDELYGDDSSTLVSSSYAPQGSARRVPGGYVLDGQWRSSSGCDHCQWAVVGSRLANSDPPGEVRHFVLPRADYQILDDWYVMGLAGTGSKSLVIEEKFVPEHRSVGEAEVSARTDLSLDPSPLYRLPRSIVYLVPGAAPAIGAALGAYEEYKRQIARYTSRRDNSSRTGDRVVQLRLAEAHSAVGLTQAQLTADCEEMMRTVRSGSTLPAGDAARYAWHITQAADACVSAVRGIFQTLGAGVVYSSNPLQRYYRDILTMRQHGTQDRDRNFAMFSQGEFGL